MKKAKKLAALMGILLLIAGCAGRNTKEESSMQLLHEAELIQEEAALNLKFEDIPVPSGFKLDTKASFVFKNDFIQAGIVKYIGRGDITKATMFYKKQMPLFDWELISAIEYRNSILIYGKDTQSSVVIIEPASTGKLAITVASGPKNTAPKAELLVSE